MLIISNATQVDVDLDPTIVRITSEVCENQ